MRDFVEISICAIAGIALAPFLSDQMARYLFVGYISMCVGIVIGTFEK